ncbi:PQQ-binding-like beta-propeller repeat protein [Mariniphaga sp.]|uniref:outer membrane protein assembly factor BamB family protein n=1 Tax=Mariniphaga sp. TaxID=1954475 RepID=UPI003567FA71
MKQVFYFIALFIFISCSNPKTKIYQWRGENRTGVYSETNLLQEWPENGPEELWFAEGIGNGYGSPTITESELFITGEKDSLAWLFCYGLSGNLIWKKQYGKEWAKHYPGSRSAPTVVDDLVYAGTGMGIISCLKRETGELVWTKDYVADFEGVLPYHGYSEAPVIFDDKILCTPGGPENNVVALNRFTGELIWSCKGMGERMGYNPGNLIELPDRKIYVTFSAYHLLGIDAETGELLWTHLQENTPVEKREPGIGDTHSNNAIYENGILYYAAGDGNRGVKLQLSKDGSQISEIWRTPDLDTYMGGFVKVGDYLYGCGTRKKDLKSFDAETGEIADSLRTGTGAIVAADDMLYYYNWGGELSLVSCENGKLHQQSTFKITRGTKEHFSHPVIKNGVLYQRHGDALMAFDIREKHIKT